MTSTAEAVAITRLVLTNVGILDEGISAHFYPGKAVVARCLQPLLLRGSERQAPGVFAHLTTRTLFYDGHIRRLIAQGSIRQFVVMGAGFDVRAYRLAWPAGTRIFEIDLAEHPGVQNYKRSVLAAKGIDTSHVTFLPIDFFRQSAADVLTAGGFDPGQPALFLWEGVTMYLSKAAIEATLQSLRSVSAPGSYLMCELFSSYLLTAEGRADPLLIPYWRTVSRSGEPYQGPQLDPEQMRPFFEENECEVVEHSTPEDQLKAWQALPLAASIDSTGTLPHGGVCHLWLVKTK